MAEFDFGGLLGNLGSAFSGGGPGALDEYLTPEQKAAMQRNAMLQASAALLKAGGRSTTRTSLGQALGQALEAGQGGYEKSQTNVLTQMTLKQKMDEAKLERANRLAFSNYLAKQAGIGGEAAPTPSGPELLAPIEAQGPAAAAPAPGGQGANRMAGLTQAQAQLLGMMDMKTALPKVLDLMQPPKTVGEPFKGTDGKTYVRTEQGGVIPFATEMAPKTVGEPFRGTDNNLYIRTELGGAIPFTTGMAPKPVGQPQSVMVGGKPAMVQSYDDGSRKLVAGESPYLAPPTDIQSVEYILGESIAGTGKPGIAQIGQYRSQIAPKNIVHVNEGQKGFENEMRLGAAFKGEPIYKDFNDMKSAYSQVMSSLDQGTPIGDVAGATKVMKLLDPGSVVRESELGIAMAAAGRMDRLQSYFNNLMTGQKLTPQQRIDFKSLSNELYSAAGQAYNQKRSEYKSFGDAYKFPNLETALGSAATVQPIIMKPAKKMVFKNGVFVFE
jgi:hypothetical protein